MLDQLNGYLKHVGNCTEVDLTSQPTCLCGLNQTYNKLFERNNKLNAVTRYVQRNQFEPASDIAKDL